MGDVPQLLQSTEELFNRHTQAAQELHQAIAFPQQSFVDMEGKLCTIL